MEIPFLPETSRPCRAEGNGKKTPLWAEQGRREFSYLFRAFTSTVPAAPVRPSRIRPSHRAGLAARRRGTVPCLRPLSPYGVNNSFMACFLTYMSLSASSKTFRREEWRS